MTFHFRTMFLWILAGALILSGCSTASPPAASKIPAAREKQTAVTRRFPFTDWQQYAKPEEAGWAPDRLEKATAYAITQGSAAGMLISEGAVVTYWGDVNRRFMAHSIRKSYLSALIGTAIEQGDLSLEQTLADLGIDDLEALTEAEKQASVQDLLTARSGVYHPAAYEFDIWTDRRPERGSHPPGTFWYYNNWDFNTLLTIYEQQTGAQIFEEIDERLAVPLQMQDYRPRDGHYLLETDLSEHPAYPLRISARDLARFGWLYANEGRWNGKQIIPAEWVAESTRTHTPTSTGDEFGYMWWVFPDGFEGHRAFYTAGGDTQMMVVFPDLDLVFVHLTDTYSEKFVSRDDVLQLLSFFLAARTGEKHPAPRLIMLPETHPVRAVRLPETELDELTGTYTYPDGHSLEVTPVEDGLALDFGFGKFDLEPLSDTEFFVEGTQERITFEKAYGSPIKLNYEALETNPIQGALGAGPAIQDDPTP